MPLSQPVEIDGQYRALREEAGVLAREQRAVLELTGPEGAELLQGQLTNDVEGLGDSEGCYAALLDRKGKMRADMRVLRLDPGTIWIELDEAVADEVERHLGTYKIGRQVEVARRPELSVTSLIGPRSAELLGVPLGTEHSHRPLRLAEADLRVVATLEGADLIADSERAAPVAEALIASGAAPVSVEAAEILRVEAGRPAFGAEMGNETIPQEAGINDRAVDFEKGCYIGQETVARLHYKGKPNRHLRRLRSEQPLRAGEPVRLGERELGSVGTAVISPAAGPLALAILRREAEPGTTVSVGENGSAIVEAIEV